MKNCDEIWMGKALLEAKRGADCGEVPVGAVVVREGELLASAHNEVELRGDATAHAELLAIREAAGKIGNWRLLGCSLFVTLEPCHMCMGAVVLSRIERVVYGARDPRLGAIVSAPDLLSNDELPRSPEIVSDVLAEESSAILKRFFQLRRGDRGCR